MPSPWLNSDPEGEFSLSYMDRLMMDVFYPTFPTFFCLNKKVKKKNMKFSFFTCWIYIISEFTGVFVGYQNGWKHSLHLVIDWKTQLEHKLCCKIKNKILLDSLCQ